MANENLDPIFRDLLNAFLNEIATESVNSADFDPYYEKELEARDRESRDVDPDEGVGFIGGPEED